MKKILTIAVLAAVLLTGCGGNRYRKISGSTWGTFYNITYKADRDLTDSVHMVLEQIDRSLSPFCEGGQLWRINSGEDVEVDSMFVTVFETARHISELSGGRFDPTVAPLVNLWGFGYREGKGEPSDSDITAVLATVGIADCRLDGRRVVRKDAATEFDFSAIAKGYGCDAVAAMLERNGCRDYLVEIGGEMALKGVNSHGQQWHIQVDAPIEDTTPTAHERAALVVLSDCGVASSGNYRNYRDTPSGRIGHTISPITGRPVTTGILAVTVIAPDAMTADALATACMTMPLNEAHSMIDGIPGVSALFITDGTEGGFMLTPTRGFPQLLTD